ncbi:MFS transporter [Streptomyces tsukubensis]|uniref:MFS transporter n=1 Tax=Streptomyces tsukubensis TaxID=83656 RepID=A0A1V4AFM9_9ACTN|nr:MFS transporter [Streptomyces tsukubensis]OON82839.1 MFS transporter [Streptomyces tsukubensis]
MAPESGEDASPVDPPAPAASHRDGVPAHHPRADASPRDVRLFWWANASDALGSQTSGIVLPLLLLSLGYSPAAVGLIAGASTAAGLLLGPLAAVPADRGARKPVMFWSATVSCLAMALVTVTVVQGDPPLSLLLGAVLLERLATTCYEGAARGTVALISPPAGYPRVVAGLEAGDRTALVIGPALGGLLYQAARALPFLADALSYAVTAICVRLMRSPLRAPEETEEAPAGSVGTAAEDGSSGGRKADGGETDGRTADRRTADGRSARPVETHRAGLGHRAVAVLAECGAGLTRVRSEPLLWMVLVWTTVVGGVLAALYYGAIFTLQRGGHGGGAMGLVLAVSGGAGLLGALMAPRVAARVGAARAVTTVTWLLVPLTAALAFVSSPWAYGALFGAFCLIMPPATVLFQSHAIRVTPPALQARTGAVLATATGATTALAPALTGLATSEAGPAAPVYGSAALLMALALYVHLGASRVFAVGRS